MVFYFTSDEHYGHNNVLKYEAKRPFSTIDEMNRELISLHNSIVTNQDITVHVGDFSFLHFDDTMKIINKLKGNHIFLMGNHDRWNKKLKYIWEKKIDGIYIVAFHYPMREWRRSFYGSIQLHGHSHGRVPPIENQYDVGVDNNNFKPISLDDILMKLNVKKER